MAAIIELYLISPFRRKTCSIAWPRYATMDRDYSPPV
jgi:hypothetical protein